VTSVTSLTSSESVIATQAEPQDGSPFATEATDGEPAGATFLETIGQPEPAATEDQEPKKAKSSLSEGVYAGEVSRDLKPISQVTTSMAIPPNQYDPDVPDKDERPRLPRAHELFAKEPVQFHGPGHFRPWPEQTSLWEAPGISSHPLYFEEVYVERYGYSFGLAQPVVSAAHFFGRIPALPYLMTVDPPHRCVYTLGHYRAGSCAPLYWEVPPFDPLAAAVQGGVVTGLVFLIP
jgi:hypothetical protein